jgi:hypothetical protein
MRRMLLLVLSGAALSACSGESPEYEYDALRIDGSVEEDGIFENDEHRAAYCSETPDSPWCTELGVGEQPWVTGEYHGRKAGGVPCYSGAGGSCYFPALKQMKIQFDVSRCSDAAPAGEVKPTAAQVTSMIVAFKEGALSWNGAGSQVTVEDGTCAWPSGCTTVTMVCENLAGSNQGSADFGSGNQTRVADLPIGPHGGNEGAANVSVNYVVRFDIWRAYFAVASATICNQTVTTTRLQRMSRQIGRHEMGHIFGFGHFNEPTGVMFPSTDCFAENGIAQVHKDALSIFNSSSGPPVSIQDVNLETQLP